MFLMFLIVDAENIVNIRPLTHLPICEHDEEPLTPNHFLIRYSNTTETIMTIGANNGECLRVAGNDFLNIFQYLRCLQTKAINVVDSVFICGDGDLL